MSEGKLLSGDLTKVKVLFELPVGRWVHIIPPTHPVVVLSCGCVTMIDLVPALQVPLSLSPAPQLAPLRCLPDS
jgi:hypothetical protein